MSTVYIHLHVHAEQRRLLTEAENGALGFRRGDGASVVKGAVVGAHQALLRKVR